MDSLPVNLSLPAHTALTLPKNGRETILQFSLPAVPTAACTIKQSKKRKTDLEKATNKKKLDSSRNEMRVNIGVTVQRWRQLMEWKA